MIIVTGGAGFIGSNLVKALNEIGHANIVVVDDLSDGSKISNIADLQIADYIDKDDFYSRLESRKGFGRPEAVFHQGACSDTTEQDGSFIMHNNYELSKRLFHRCLEDKTPFTYASSASVYGAGRVFGEDSGHESPLNPYAYSKFLFDQYVRRHLPEAESPIAGLRYFNVYGPREQHKGKMSSVAFQFDQQIVEAGIARLFQNTDGQADGEQRRDFIYVRDVVEVNLWLLANPGVSGIFNLGTGRSQSFNDVAEAVINFHGKGRIEYIPFPEALTGRYQNFTEADMTALRKAGYDHAFKTVEEGVRTYLEWLYR